MKLKILIVLSLATVIGFAGCKSETNTNLANANVANTNMMAKTPETAKTDPALQKSIEEALKAKGFNDVTVDTSGPKVVLRGTAPKDKFPEIIETAQQANGGKPVDNQVQGK